MGIAHVYRAIGLCQQGAEQKLLRVAADCSRDAQAPFVSSSWQLILPIIPVPLMCNTGAVIMLSFEDDNTAREAGWIANSCY
jgi:methylaspartate ammonia-lyase